jgi:3'(2'), 5'-bisphosphate nucleotidase
MDYEKELQTALAAAQRASQAILALYADYQPVADAPADISTEADHRSQELIVDHLHQAFPADAFCAEEATAMPAATPTSNRNWVVDPIDGTRGFARKNGEFSVMIGLLDNDKIALGIVLEPAQDRLTYAVRGNGCFCCGGWDSNPVRCRVSQAEDLARSTLIQSHSKRGSSPSAELQALRPGRVVESYSAGIKLARVARGEADIYLNTYSEFHDWDICAGHILVEEAGGTVTGLGGETLRYGAPGAWQRAGLLASNGRIHAAALAALKKLRRT